MRERFRKTPPGDLAARLIAGRWWRVLVTVGAVVGWLAYVVLFAVNSLDSSSVFQGIFIWFLSFFIIAIVLVVLWFPFGFMTRWLT